MPVKEAPDGVGLNIHGYNQDNIQKYRCAYRDTETPEDDLRDYRSG